MSDSAQTISTATVPLMDDKFVQALFAILRENQANTGDLLAVMQHVSAMEQQLHAAVGELAAMRREVNNLQHPVKTAVQKAIRSLEHKIADAREKLATVRESIVEGCKNAVAAFREKGVMALDGLASFFHIRQGLEAVEKTMGQAVRLDQKSIDKIAAVSAEYHEIGKHMKNLGRAIRGKEAAAEVKPMGWVAKTVQAPYKLDRAVSSGVRKAARSALAGLDRLEQRADLLREEKETGGQKPSLIGNLQAMKQQAAQTKADAPAPDRPKKSQENAL